MKKTSIVSNRVLKINQSILIVLFVSGLSGCGILDYFFKDTTTITVKALSKTLHQGESSNIDATVTTKPANGTPVASHSVKFEPDTTIAGSLNVLTKATDGSGISRVVFTAVKVDVDTVVTITGTTKNGSGNSHSDSVTVMPPIIFGDFGGDDSGTSITNADITITTSVTKLDTNKYQYDYMVSYGNPANVDHMVLNFEVPMDSVTSNTGVTMLNSSTANIGLVLKNQVTITAICSDCEAGGSTRFVIFDLPLPSVPSDPRPNLFSKDVTGPTAP